MKKISSDLPFINHFLVILLLIYVTIDITLFRDMKWMALIIVLLLILILYINSFFIQLFIENTKEKIQIIRYNPFIKRELINKKDIIKIEKGFFSRTILSRFGLGTTYKIEYLNYKNKKRIGLFRYKIGIENGVI